MFESHEPNTANEQSLFRQGRPEVSGDLKTAEPLSLGREPWHPPFDVHSVEGGAVVIFDLPGVQQKDLHLSLKGRWLSVWGHREPPTPASRELQREGRWRGSFGDHLLLPEGVYDPKPDIHLEHGVLTLEFRFLSFNGTPEMEEPS